MPNGVDTQHWHRRASRAGSASRSSSPGGGSSTRRASRCWPGRSPTCATSVPGIRCVIAGRGGYLAELQSQIDVEGVGDLVHLAGFVPDDELRALLRRAGCVVIPSLYEPFGIVALEGDGRRRADDRRPHRRPRRDRRGHAAPACCSSRAATSSWPHASARCWATTSWPRRCAPRPPTLLAEKYTWDAIAASTLGVYKASPTTSAERSLTSCNAAFTGRSHGVASVPRMRAVREFNVVPAIPEPLRRPHRAGHEHPLDVGSRDPGAVRAARPDGWETTGHDPLRLIAAITAERWAELAADPSIVEADAAPRPPGCDDAIDSPRWFQGRAGHPARPRRLLLARVRASPRRCRSTPAASASSPATTSRRRRDLGVPLVGIGLLYAEGYFRQRLNADGWQEERFPRLDPTGLALTPTDVDGRASTSPATSSRSRRGGSTSAGCRCTCSTPRSTATAPTAARSPTGCTAATSSTACARRSCSASAACASCARLGLDAAGVPQQRGPRRVQLAGAHPRAGRRRG